jgi:transposase
MTRTYGRAAPSQRVVDNAPHPPGTSTTTIAVIGLTGITAPLVLPGAMSGDIFHTYIERCVVPTLRAGDILVMDNLAAHKVAGLAELLQTRHARLMYLPPYSPDFNPIELAWAKAKTGLRRLKARTVATLIPALGQALSAITPQNARAWFAHCGYPIK